MGPLLPTHRPVRFSSRVIQRNTGMVLFEKSMCFYVFGNFAREFLWIKFHSRTIAPSRIDTDRRIQFCEHVQERLRLDPAYLRKIKFSDECVFGLVSRVNQHNLHQWATENPYYRIGNPGKTPTLTVWVCMG